VEIQRNGSLSLTLHEHPLRIVGISTNKITFVLSNSSFMCPFISSQTPVRASSTKLGFDIVFPLLLPLERKEARDLNRAV
jgi:hypothetical protein